MVIAELLASLGVDVDKKAFKDIDTALGGVAKSATKILGGIGILLGGVGITQFVGDLIRVGGELDDASRKFGVSTKTLQAWRFAAGQTGASAEAVGNALKFTAKNAYDAATGGKESAAAFAKLGVSVKDASGNVRDTDSVFLDTLNGLAGVENNTERTALALKVLGRGAADMLPLIAQGKDGIAALRAEFEELGGGFSDEFVAEADALGDSLDSLTESGKGLRQSFGLAVFPILQKGVDVLIKLAKWFRHVTRGSQVVKTTLAVMAAAFIAWGIAAAWAARQAIVGWLVAAAPFLLVAAAVAALGLVLDDVRALLTGGKSLIGKYLDEWFGVGTADALVRNWSEGIRVLTDTVTAMGEAISNTADVMINMAMDVYAFWSDTIKNIVGDWTSGIGIIGDTIKGAMASFDDWLDPTGERKKKRLDGDAKRSFMKGRLGNVDKLENLSGATFGPGLGGLPGDAVNRVNRDGSAFFDFAAHPGVAAPDAVHPALRPGAVPATGTAAGGGTTAVTNAPITINAAPGMSEREIGRQAAKHIEAANEATAHRVRAANVNRPRKAAR